ncbi:MAG TPA: acyltransferase [Streptosporangiaceae bacterium]|nr:acyltransferase [Streptosporangiaceae bacterium]
MTAFRFWAALVVVLYHLSRQVGPIPGVQELVWYGRTGVTFFFVLSGFVLAWTYDGAGISAAVILWRRFARIWPLHAVTTVISVVVYLAIGTAVPVSAVMASLALVHAWFPSPVIFTGGNPAAWSISDEAWFYLIFPALLAVLAVQRSRAWLWTAVIVSTSGVLLWLASSQIADGTMRTWFIDYLPLTRSPQFVLGVVAGLAVKRGWRPPIRLPAAVLVVIGWHVALFLWSTVAADTRWYGPYTASEVLSAPIFAAMICAAAHRDRADGPGSLGRPWMIRLGNWSYAWYLVHEIVIRAYVHVIGRPATGLATARAWFLVIMTSLTVAGLCHRFIEQPAERRLRSMWRPKSASGRSAAGHLDLRQTSP